MQLCRLVRLLPSCVTVTSDDDQTPPRHIKRITAVVGLSLQRPARPRGVAVHSFHGRVGRSVYPDVVIGENEVSYERPTKYLTLKIFKGYLMVFCLECLLAVWLQLISH